MTQRAIDQPASLGQLIAERYGPTYRPLTPFGRPTLRWWRCPACNADPAGVDRRSLELNASGEFVRCVHGCDESAVVAALGAVGA